MKTFPTYIAGLFLMFFTFSGCTILPFGDFTEGEIEFDITYPNLDEGNAMAELYPDLMSMQIKDNNYITNMSAGFGMFRTSYVTNCNEKSLTQLVDLLGKKYALTKDSLSLQKDWPKLVIEPTGKTKEIMGYVCTEAVVAGADGEQVKIYYTNEIIRNGLNWDNEFYGLDGFLMEYEMRRYGLEMRFTCSSIEKKDVPESLFENPSDGYEFISEEKMSAIFENFQ